MRPAKSVFKGVLLNCALSAPNPSDRKRMILILYEEGIITPEEAEDLMARHGLASA